MSYSSLEIVRAGHVATVWLNRPQVRNAFDDAAIADITHAFRKLGSDSDIRAIVLAARGPAFCAGADLNWMKKMAAYTHDENLADAKRLADMLHTIYTCPKPVIAQVQGDCYGGGVGLIAACDIAVAAEGVNFCLSEVKLGLIPATISPYVIKAMGERAAHRYFLTAEKFSAQEAHRVGFVHEAVAVDALEAKVGEIVNALVTVSPNAATKSKRLVRDVTDSSLDAALIADTVQRIADMRVSDDGIEGIRAFLAKRKPGWIP